MKKTYKKPVMALINIENEQILAGSGLNRSLGQGEVLGKGMDDDWDDEEDF